MNPHRRNLRFTAVVWATLATCPSPASAQVFESLGVRALGMGGAFVAVADDATANYWNPAGLATGPFLSALVDFQTTATRTDRGRDSSGMDGSALIVSLATPALGLAYYDLRSRQVAVDGRDGGGMEPAREDQQSGDVTLGSLVTRHASLTVVQLLVPGVAVGTAVKLVRGTAALELADATAVRTDLRDAAAELEGKASHAFDLDIGVMAALQRFRVGLVVRNLRAPEFATPTGAQLVLTRQVRAGVAVLPTERSVLAVDVDVTQADTAVGGRRNVAVGVEQWLWQGFGVRAGLRVSLRGEAWPSGAVGASWALAICPVDRGADDPRS